MSSCRAICPRA